MQDKLKAIVALQKVDMEIASLRKAADVHPKQMAELEKEQAAARSAVEAERNLLADLERQKRTLEQNIQDEKEKVKKWEARLAEQRSTREYAALAREIDIAKKANQTMADELVELGKTIVLQRETVKTKDQEFAAKQDQLAGRINDLRSKMQASEGQVKELEAKRTQVAGSVDATLLRRYDTIRKKKLPAMVAVKDGTCAGCNMNVPPQQYNALCVSLGTDVCPSCNRMIYAAMALETPAAK